MHDAETRPSAALGRPDPALLAQLQAEAAAPQTYPLSFAQQRLLFVEQLRPGTPAYNILQAFRIRGSLDVAALRRALNAVVARHEALRTTFGTEAGEPMQCVADELEIDIGIRELTADGPVDREQRLRELGREITAEPFDLERGPLLRAHLYRIGPDDHALYLVVHHAVADGWSVGVLVKELGHCYRAAVQGRAPTLPPLEIQYGDYALWQREHLADPRVAAQVRYWTERLETAPRLLELPADRPRPAVQDGAGARLWFDIPGTLAL